MKVILLQDVAKIGKKGEVADVPNGYAMNSLVPSGKAMAATGGNLKQAQAKAAAMAVGVADSAAAFDEAKAMLTKTSPRIEAAMNDQDHMFEAVSADAVVAAAAVVGATITADMVKFAEPIKAAGEHEVALVSGDQHGTFTLIVSKTA